MLAENDIDINPYSPRYQVMWRRFLEEVKYLLNNQPHPTCFISYAWPPAGEERIEIHHRLSMLKADLEFIGATVLLDITNLTSNINVYMDRINDCDFVLFIGTPKLKSRLTENGENNAKYEYRLIQQKLTHQPNSLLPLLFDGSFETSFPTEISNSILIRDCRLSINGWSQGRDVYMRSLADHQPMGLIPALFEQLTRHNTPYQSLHTGFLCRMDDLQNEHTRECGAWYQNAERNARANDYSNAYAFYKLAARARYGPACYKVGFFHHVEDTKINNRPVPRDISLAANWFTLGARFGHIKSMLQTAEILAYNAKRNEDADAFVKAITWAERAVNQSDARNRQASEHTLQKVRRLQAEYLAGKGDAQALYESAWFLYHSRGGIMEPKTTEEKQRQFHKALQYAERARDNGHVEALQLITVINNALGQLPSTRTFTRT